MKSAIVLATVGALAACGPRIPDTLTIAVAQPLSGPQANRGKDLLDGAKLAVDELNKSGFKIAGKPVTLELVSIDDKADIATAKQVAHELVDRKVLAVIGHLSSEITAGTIPIYKQGDVVQMFTSSAAELTKLGDGNTFRLVPNDTMQAKALAGFAVEGLHAKSVALIHEDTIAGNPIKNDFTAHLAKSKATLAVLESVDTKTTDFTAFVAKLKAARPDVVVAAFREHQALSLMSQMRAAGLSEMPVIVASPAKTSKVAQAPADVAKLYSTISTPEPREFGGGAEFLSKFRAAYNADPVWAAHYAYDAVHVLAQTLLANGNADKEALRAKLRTIDAIAPVTGVMRFDANGEPRYGAITVYERGNGNWLPLMRSDRW